jgi:hypothetical protein
VWRKVLRAVASPVTVPAKKVARGIQYVRASHRLDRVTDLIHTTTTEPMGKSLFKSKTFWVNVLFALADVAEVLPIPEDYRLPALGIINIALRLLTAEPIAVITKFLAAAGKDKPTL